MIIRLIQQTGVVYGGFYQAYKQVMRQLKDDTDNKKLKNGTKTY